MNQPLTIYFRVALRYIRLIRVILVTSGQGERITSFNDQPLIYKKYCIVKKYKIFGYTILDSNQNRFNKNEMKEIMKIY